MTSPDFKSMYYNNKARLQKLFNENNTSNPLLGVQRKWTLAYNKLKNGTTGQYM